MAEASKRSPSLSAVATSGIVWGVASLLQASHGHVARSGPRSTPPQPPAPARPAAAAADGPEDLPARKWGRAIRRTITSFSDNRLLAVAAGVTFYVLLALFPAIAAFVSLYGLVADASTINEHVHAMGDLLPGGAVDILTAQVSRISSNGHGTLGLSFGFGILVSLWSANAGVKAMFDALNVAYQQEERRGFIQLNLVALAFTLGGIVLGAVAMSAITIVPIVLNTVGLGGMAQWILWAARWPALLLILIVALAAIYRFGPSHNDAHWQWLTPGSAIASVVWLIFSMLFSWYVANFGSYNETYGTLGAVVGFMTWMWLSTAIVLIGAAINAELETQATRTKGGHTASMRRETRTTPEPQRA